AATPAATGHPRPAPLKPYRSAPCRGWRAADRPVQRPLMLGHRALNQPGPAIWVGQPGPAPPNKRRPPPRPAEVVKRTKEGVFPMFKRIRYASRLTTRYAVYVGPVSRKIGHPVDLWVPLHSDPFLRLDWLAAKRFDDARRQFRDDIDAGRIRV